MDIMKKRYIIFIFMTLSVIVVIVSSIPFRSYPTHMIVKHVNCFSCHTEEFNDLNIGYHIRSMNDTQNRFLFDYVDIYGNESEPYRTLEGSCYSCHITYKNYDLFGLTDPYVSNSAVGGLDAQYGYIIRWPAGNMAVEYFGTGNAAITAELEVLSTIPSNSAVDSTIKIVLSNYSEQQTSGTIYDDSKTLYPGDVQTLTVGNIAEDYFSIILVLDGMWNNSVLDLRLSGTDKGTESFIINANNPPAIYNIPKDISNRSYFRTNGTYKAVRLDYVWSEWKNYIIGNIASLEDIQTNNTNGWITANTCSTPDAWCHINQKTTYMGINDGMNPDRSFYPHNMQIVTTVQCKLCHLRGSLIKGGDGTGTGPVPKTVPGPTSGPTTTPGTTSTPGPTPGPTTTPGTTPGPTTTPGTTPGTSSCTGVETGTPTFSTKLYYNINGQSRTLYNNVWGATDAEINGGGLSSYIYYRSDGCLGWEWQRSSQSIPIYPEVIIGAIPGDSDYTTPIFPIKYGDISSWTSEINFKYTKVPNGKNNLAYDIYWMNGDTKMFNVMIWVQGHHDESPIGEVSDGTNTYIHYKRAAGVGQYWEWHAFELKDQNVQSNNVDIKKLLDNAFSPGTIDGNWIIPGMELGSEVWGGSGRVEIDRYVAYVNGNNI